MGTTQRRNLPIEIGALLDAAPSFAQAAKLPHIGFVILSSLAAGCVLAEGQDAKDLNGAAAIMRVRATNLETRADFCSEKYPERAFAIDIAVRKWRQDDRKALAGLSAYEQIAYVRRPDLREIPNLQRAQTLTALNDLKPWEYGALCTRVARDLRESYWRMWRNEIPKTYQFLEAGIPPGF